VMVMMQIKNEKKGGYRSECSKMRPSCPIWDPPRHVPWKNLPLFKWG
jgi:hypothetical protein